jgi:hypothetical protein
MGVDVGFHVRYAASGGRSPRSNITSRVKQKEQNGDASVNELHYIALSELNSYNVILPHPTVSHRIAATPYASYDEGPEA